VFSFWLPERPGNSGSASEEPGRLTVVAS